MIDFQTTFWSLPSSLKFLRQVGNDVRDGVNNILVYPNSVDFFTLRLSVSDYFERERLFRTTYLDLSSSNERNFFDLLCDYFNELLQDQYIEKAVDNPCLPDVILIGGTNSLSSIQLNSWLKDLSRWATACKVTGSTHCILFFLPSTAFLKSVYPNPDIRLRYKSIVGFPSALEMRLLCRMATENLDAENLWREHILSSLCGNDPRLIELLWDCNSLNLQNICERLKQHTLLQEIENSNISLDDELQDWKPQEKGVLITPVPGDNKFRLACSGVTLFTPEYGEELHPSILAKKNLQIEIEQRLWRAQAALILPIIDDYRRRICAHFTQKYGNYWAEIDNHVLGTMLEIGELNHYINQLPDSSKEKQKWKTGVNKAWKLRNSLAHDKSVSYSDYLNFWDLNNQQI